MVWPIVKRLSNPLFNGYKLTPEMAATTCVPLPTSLRATSSTDMVSGESLYLRSMKLKINHLVMFRGRLLMLHTTGIYSAETFTRLFSFGPLETVQGLSLVAVGDFLVLSLPPTELYIFTLAPDATSLSCVCSCALNNTPPFTVHSVSPLPDGPGCHIILHSCVESVSSTATVRAEHTLTIFRAIPLDSPPSSTSSTLASSVTPPLHLIPLCRLQSLCRSPKRYGKDGDLYAPLASGCLSDGFFVLSYAPFTSVNEPLPPPEELDEAKPMVLFSFYNYDGAKMNVKNDSMHESKQEEREPEKLEEKGAMDEDEDENDMQWANTTRTIDVPTVFHLPEALQTVPHTSPTTTTIAAPTPSLTTTPTETQTNTLSTNAAIASPSIPSTVTPSTSNTRFIPYLRFLFRDVTSNNVNVLGLIDGSDVCVFHVTSSADLEHVCTFGGLGYLAKGKPQKNFVCVSPETHKYAFIADYTKHIWLYRRAHSPAELQCPQALLDCEDRIMGVHLTETHLFVLTSDSFYRCQLTA